MVHHAGQWALTANALAAELGLQPRGTTDRLDEGCAAAASDFVLVNMFRG